jgi:ATP-binding cassette subfamily G (WHITE) protein 2 (SNQ2)
MPRKHDSIRLEPFNEPDQQTPREEENGFQYLGIAPLPPPGSPPTSPMNPSMHTYLDPRGSSVYRVSLDYFDPAGVRELRRRSLTSSITHDLRPAIPRQSLHLSPAHEITEEQHQTHHLSNAPSHMTLVGGNTMKKEKKGQLASTSEESLDTLDSHDIPDIKDTPFDFEKSLYSFMKGREDGTIQPRELGVMFQNLTVTGLSSAQSYQPTLGSLFNPKRIMEGFQTSRHPQVRDILSGLEGVVCPGEMLLVLGSPGSGCTSLLKMLANQREGYHEVKGEVHYDSLSPEEMKKHYRGDLQYCAEDDIHFPSLTVGQTLDFAATTRAPHNRVVGSRQEFTQSFTEVLSTVFGLRHTKDTPVGDAAIRGVSGGEKKRVSIAETLASRALVTAWDNSTRGLDSSTALEFVRALRIATDSCRLATIVSLYQAGESLYQHFDKVCVLYEGKMAYFGPTDRAKAYFMKMGYEPANRQTTPDFLVAVTDPNARIPRNGFSNLPRTASDFARHFWKSSLGQLNRKEIERYRKLYVGKPERALAYKTAAEQERANNSPKGSPYITSIPMQMRAVIKRRIQIMKGTRVIVAINLSLYLFQAIIMGTVFLNSPVATSAFFSRGGVLFFAMLFNALTTMAEIPALFAQRPIVLRQQKAAFYHPFVEALALTIVDAPITILINTVFTGVLYLLIHLQRTPGQFFTFLLFVCTLALTMKACFRALAAFAQTPEAAQTMAGVLVLAFSLYTGFSIPKPTMIGALRWITNINPIYYAFQSAMTNEFRTINATCSQFVPDGPGYENVTLANKVCTTPGSMPGQELVDGSIYVELAYGFHYSDVWRNFGISVAFCIGFFLMLLYFTQTNIKSAFHNVVVQYKMGSVIEPSSSSKDEEKLEEAVNPDYKNWHENHQTVVDPMVMTDIFSWHDINYTVPVPTGERKLLDGISGYVAPGKLTALMGESGAGKTTLLNVLAQRTTSGVVTGQRLVNGQGLPLDFQSQTGYCQQMDTHVPSTTVREALLFSAKLRQPPSVPLYEKEAYVEKCLKMVGLEKYGDAIVGTLGIEYQKRTTIGVELAAKPRLLLFLDEPTSGLDSQSSWAILQCLRDLANSGQAILCTIHQPSAELFQVFDRLLLLRKGGKTCYFGDLGHRATTLISYFERNGGRECKPEENPAEYMLEVIGAGATATSSQDWHETWKHTDEARYVAREMEGILRPSYAPAAVQELVTTEFATSWFTQFKELTVRDLRAHWRNPEYMMAKIMLNIVAGLFIGFTFYKPPDTQQGTQNKLFAIFMSLVLTVPLSNQLQVTFIKMRDVYEIRERPSRMYSWTALVTSQFVSALPWNFLGTTLYFICWYWTVGFDTNRAGYTYLMLGIIFPLYYTSIALAVAAMASTPELAAILFTFLFSFVLTFNGVIQPFRGLGWWRWVYRINPFTYLVEGLLGQAVGRQLVTCSDVEYVTVEPLEGMDCGGFLGYYIENAGGYLWDINATSQCRYCPIRTTDQFLGPGFNIFYEHHWRNFGLMIIFIAFNIACLYAMTYIFRIRRSRL